MSGKGDGNSNIVADSFAGTVEFALTMKHDWHAREEARKNFETWYNQKRTRWHSALGYLSPIVHVGQSLAAA